MNDVALTALRRAAVRWERARFVAVSVGADLGRFLAGRRYWLAAVDAGWLRTDGPAVLLTVEGLAAAAIPTWTPGAAPVRQREERRAPVLPPRYAPREQVMTGAPGATVTMRMVGPQPGARTLATVRRDVRAIYAARALRAVRGALTRWERTFFEAPRAGLDLRRFLFGKKRYWQSGGGDADYLRGAVLTEAGLAAVASYAPAPRPSARPFSCCADLRTEADAGHAAACAATRAA